MSEDSAEFPYKKFTLIFTALNTLFLFIYGLPYLWLATAGLGTFAYDAKSEPAEFIPLLFILSGLILVSVIAVPVCLISKKKKAAFIIAVLPVIIFAILIVLNLFILSFISADLL